MSDENNIVGRLRHWLGLAPREKKLSAEAARAIQHVINGIVLYYRDTDLHGLTERGLAHIGQIVETDRPVLMTRLTGRCEQRIRFVIASALLNNEPQTVPGLADAETLRTWDAQVLRPGSLLKVIDVYRYHNTTQVVLLHIDHHHARFFRPGGEVEAVNILTLYSRHTAGYDLVEITRASLRDKHDLGPRHKSDEERWRRLTAPLFCPVLADKAGNSSGKRNGEA